MFGGILDWLMGNGMTNGAQPSAGVPTPSTTTPMPTPTGNPMLGQYGPPMPNMGQMPGMNPAQGQDLRKEMLMKMLSQGMMGQGQGQPQSPQVPPMSMAPGRPPMPFSPDGSIISALTQRNAPTMAPRRPLGMGY